MCKAHGVPPERPATAARGRLSVGFDATPLLGHAHRRRRLLRRALGGLAARADLDVSAFAVSWRRRRRIAALVPAGVATTPAGHAGPTAARRLGPPAGAAGRVVHRRRRRRPRDQLRGAADPPGGPGGDRPRPDRGPVPRAVRPADPGLSGPHPPGGGRGGVGAHAVAVRGRRGGGRARRSTRRGCGPSTTACPGSPTRRRGRPADEPAAGLPDGCRRYVLAVGTIEPRKDYPLLVRRSPRWPPPTPTWPW